MFEAISHRSNHDHYGKVECGLLYLGRYSDRDGAVVRFTRWSRNGRRTRWKSCYSNTTFLSKDSKQRFHTRKRQCLQLRNLSFCWYQEFLRLYLRSCRERKECRGARNPDESKSDQIFTQNTKYCEVTGIERN